MRVLMCLLLRKAFWNPVLVMKSVLIVTCEHIGSNYLEQTEGVQSWLYWTLSVCSINFFSPFFFFSFIFGGIQNRQEYLKGLEDPFGKWPALARSPRECIGFTFYRELEWHNPESTTCLLVFIYKPLQKSSIKSDACFGQMLSESTHTSSQA